MHKIPVFVSLKLKLEISVDIIWIAKQSGSMCNLQRIRIKQKIVTYKKRLWLFWQRIVIGQLYQESDFFWGQNSKKEYLKCNLKSSYDKVQVLWEDQKMWRNKRLFLRIN